MKFKNEIKCLNNLEESLIDELNIKINRIEMEMDLRVESIISAIHSTCNALKEKLHEIKEDTQGYFTLLNKIKEFIENKK